MPRGRGRRRPPQLRFRRRVVVPVDVGAGQLQVAERDVDVLLDVRRPRLQQQHADVRVLGEARRQHAPGRARSDDHVVVHRTSSSVRADPTRPLGQSLLRFGSLASRARSLCPQAAMSGSWAVADEHPLRELEAWIEEARAEGAAAAGLGRLRHRRRRRPALGPDGDPEADRGRGAALHLGAVDAQGAGDRGQPAGRAALPLAVAGPPGRTSPARRRWPSAPSPRSCSPSATSPTSFQTVVSRQGEPIDDLDAAARPPRPPGRGAGDARRPAPRTGARCGCARRRSSSGAKPTTACTSAGSSSATARAGR